MREYHALRVNLTPEDVDKLEANHHNLSKYISTLKDQLSEGRMAVATATVDGHGEPVHPSLSGTVTGYVNGVLKTVKNDTSLNLVEHPWTKRAPRGAYAIAAAAAEAEAAALANIASINARKDGTKTAPMKESRRKRRRRQNRSNQKRQADLLNSHDTSDGLPKTDLQQTFRDVNRNRSMLEDAMKDNKPRKKSYSEPLVRPSTAPPPKSPFGALKLLQHVLTYDMYEYKNALPREIGPGHYDLTAALPPTIKDPNRPSASFLSPHGHQLIKPVRENEDIDNSGEGGTTKVPTTFSGRQKMIAKILKEQGVGDNDNNKNRKLSPYDRMTRGLRPKGLKRRGIISHSLSGSESAPQLLPPPSIGSSLWDDAFYSVPASRDDIEIKHSKLDPISESPTREKGITPIPFDRQDLFYRPSSPIFRFPLAKRFTEVTEPHWKGLGSPFNMEKDLACWRQSKVYIDGLLPRDGGSSRALKNKEEGPRNLDQSFNSMVKNVLKGPIAYKSSFHGALPRFLKTKTGSDFDMPDPNNLKKWEAYQGSLASDITRPSLSFESKGHPEDSSVIITMGSQYDKQKPRFLPSRALKEQLAALKEEDNTDEKTNGKLRNNKSRGKISLPRKKKSMFSPTTNRSSPSTGGITGIRPSTTVVKGSRSMGNLAQTI
jgi:hypothetical protein